MPVRIRSEPNQSLIPDINVNRTWPARRKFTGLPAQTDAMETLIARLVKHLVHE